MLGAEGGAVSEGKVLIFDTTLRDGEQAPGITLTPREKLEIAEQLARLGVDIIEAGFPITSPGDFEAVKLIATEVRGPVMAALARCDPKDIEMAWEALRRSERPRIHVFISTSDVHMTHMLRKGEEEVLEQAVEGVRLARNFCPDVEFSPQDATRTRPEFLYRVVRAAIEAGATTVNIPDTVGYALPHEFAWLIRSIRENVPEVEGVTLSVHCHNDLGLAVANSIAALREGARQVEVAVNGIGERAGNCSLEEVVMILKTRKDLLGLECGVNTREIARTSRLVSKLTGYPVQPNKAVVGANAFAHESGIHQHGVLMERSTYEIMTAEELGFVGGQIVLGKHSGRHAFAKALEDMGYRLPREVLDRVFARFKELADRKISMTQMDLEALVADEVGGGWEGDLTLESLEVHGGTGVTPEARVGLRRGEVLLEARATGDGMIDAACRAISEAAGFKGELVSFHVSAVTGGADALGDVTVQVDVEGNRYTGRGVSTDVVEASARAFLAAVNRAARATARGQRGATP